MDEFEQRIRRANPSSTSRHQPLSERAERELQELLGTPRTAQQQTLSFWRRGQVPLLAAAAVMVVFILVTIGVLTPRPTWAATPPLLSFDAYPLDAMEALKQMSETAGNSPEADERAQQNIHMQSWVLNVVEEGGETQAFVLPEEVSIVRYGDGARDITVTAGEPFNTSGEPVDTPDAPAPGTELWSEATAAGEYQFIFPEPPPTNKTDMRAYLEQFGENAGDIVSSISLLLTEWELTPQQESALLLVLADLPDLETAGKVTDRLGREGVAFATPDVAGYHQLIVVSETTGHILSVETIYTGRDRVDIQSPAVIAYYAWERN